MSTIGGAPTCGELTGQFWEACTHQRLMQVLGRVGLHEPGPVQPDEQGPVAMFTEALLP